MPAFEHAAGAPRSALAKVDTALLNELMDPYEIHILKCATDSTDLLVEMSPRPFETISAALSKLKGGVSKWLNEPTHVKGPKFSNSTRNEVRAFEDLVRSWSCTYCIASTPLCFTRQY